ncbi:penicillin-insensitive murein endopeptidase [Massilia consociata]|uniref:Penicillin-insensitive murein endopeptidase n=1 Tax=Massilia consociata TaxID=760117 RepID=A0ABV6FHS4_9BURK
MRSIALALTSLMLVVALPAAPALASTCFGTPGNGRIVHAVALSVQGRNFSPYSELGVSLGRTYVHATVRDIVESAYTVLAQELPGVKFVYGETGLKNGGPMPPHRTHRNGTSVDFMVPVRNHDGVPATLPASPLNRFGYDLEFDGNGRLDDLRIDFVAIAAHLNQLDKQARQRGTRISRVIFDPGLTRHLLGTLGGTRLASLPFMKAKPWIRHDEHYHVDFAIACKATNSR